MESVIIIGVLGALGYVMKTTKPDHEGKTQPVSEGKLQPTAQQLTDEYNRNVAKHLIKPNVIIGGQTYLGNQSPFYNARNEPNTTPYVPFFTSEKSQNTNEMVKNRRLETFTGVNNIDYAPKIERVSEKPVKGLTSINGVTFEPDIGRYKSYMANAIQHNVTPVEKKYVGPGLGIPADQISSGGFHDRFRILPDNVNAYRKNTFGAEIVPGKSNIDRRDMGEHQVATKNLAASNLSYIEQKTIGSRPFDAARGYISAPASQPNAQVSLSDMNNRSHTTTAGLVGGVSGHGGGSYQYGEGTRVSEHTLPQGFVGGIHRAGAATGGYHNEKYLMATENNRGTANSQHLNIAATNSAGSYKTPNFTSMESLRGNQRVHPEQQFGGATNASNGASFPSRDGWNAERTQKDLTMEFNKDTRLGIIGSGVSSGVYTGVQNADSARTTQRGQQGGARGHVSLSGPAGAHISNGINHKATTHAIHASRELATVMGHVPNVQKTVNLMLGSEHLNGTITAAKNDRNDNRISSNSNGLGVQNFSSRSQLGQVGVSNHVDVNNRRDFGYAPRNELRTSII
jgi:hypothetical protein